MTVAQSDYAQFALVFAKALMNNEFEFAHDLLTEELKTDYSPVLLQQTYQDMISYFLIPPTEISVVCVMEDWQYPPKQTTDIGWAYVSIHSDSECEAVTVIVCKKQNRYAIRHIDWGRP